VIASLAMSESIGIYGLVLFLLGKNSTDLYLLVGRIRPCFVEMSLPSFPLPICLSDLFAV
jgi:hypothetical protein